MTLHTRNLGSLVRAAALATPNAVAVTTTTSEASYAELDALAQALAARFAALGVGRGDRVALWLRKGIVAVAAMQATLRLGAIYVPIDPDSPTVRARRIVVDAGATLLIRGADQIGAPLGTNAKELRLDELEAGLLSSLATVDHCPSQAMPNLLDEVGGEDLAYILYTSGSTGTPKGVAISHRAALAFVDWATAELDAGPSDRFGSHAPFHFDLSVLDLYVAFRVGARVCLIPESMAYMPTRLVAFMQAQALTIWYSVPSALILMIEGGLLDISGPGPRVIAFAGEPFPIHRLRELRMRFRAARLLNLYGPTETNVCTRYEVRSIDDDRTTPVPIGAPCCGDRAWAETPEGRVAVVGEIGELLVTGPTLMSGYWGQGPVSNPYRTGDRVRVLADGEFEYLGRLDQMLKIRGHRIEAGEVEAALIEHPRLSGVAVTCVGEGIRAKLVAFVTLEPGATAPGLLELKRHCAERLPRSMIIDLVEVVPQLPRNANGKLDRRALSRSGDTHGPRKAPQYPQYP